MIGDYLFALTHRDLQVTPLGVVNQKILKVAAAALLTGQFDVPIDRAFWWTGYFLRAFGGAAQNVATVDGIMYLAPDFGEIGRFLRAAPLTLDWNTCTGTGTQPGVAGRSQAPQLLMPGTRLWFEANFIASAAPNTLEVTVQGILIPRGNLAFQSLASA